jgi:hypothetical protein
MMNGLSIDNRDIPDAIRRGMGAAARAVGAWCDLYRPQGPNAPTAGANRLLRLPATFGSPSGFKMPVGYGDVLWEGYFDAGYSCHGDYLAGADGVFFVASQPRLGPVLCVRTNRVLSFSRPGPPVAAGVNRYVGVQPDMAAPLLTDWPASVLAAGVGGRGALPADAPGVHGGSGGWAALLPAVRAGATQVLLRPGDLVHDDIGRAGVVASAELTHLGWRLHIRQAAS